MEKVDEVPGAGPEDFLCQSIDRFVVRVESDDLE
jgi:hypothetical protein